MRFDLASPASMFFFLLVPFLLAPIVIGQQHQVDITRLDPRASFGTLTTLVKNNAPPGYGRDHHGSGDGTGAGGRGSSILKVKDEHDTRDTSGYRPGISAAVVQRAIKVDVKRGSGQPMPSVTDEHGPGRAPDDENQASKGNTERVASKLLTAARGPSNEVTASRPTINSLSPAAMALCAQEAANARQDLTAARVGAVKSRRFADSDNEVSEDAERFSEGSTGVGLSPV